MALTLKVEQKLGDNNLIEFFENSQDVWTALAQESRTFVSQNFPDGVAIRKDDVADALTPLLEVNEELRGYLIDHSLRQKYWFRYFCDLILDRVWDGLE